MTCETEIPGGKCDKNRSLFEGTYDQFIIISNFPFITFKMDGFQVKALFWAKNDVIEQLLMIISMLNEIVMTQLKFDSVRIRHE